LASAFIKLIKRRRKEKHMKTKLNAGNDRAIFCAVVIALALMCFVMMSSKPAAAQPLAQATAQRASHAVVQKTVAVLDVGMRAHKN
jgi:uncharacterized membrane protein